MGAVQELADGLDLAQSLRDSQWADRMRDIEAGDGSPEDIVAALEQAAGNGLGEAVIAALFDGGMPPAAWWRTDLGMIVAKDVAARVPKAAPWEWPIQYTGRVLAVEPHTVHTMAQRGQIMRSGRRGYIDGRTACAYLAAGRSQVSS